MEITGGLHHDGTQFLVWNRSAGSHHRLSERAEDGNYEAHGSRQERGEGRDRPLGEGTACLYTSNGRGRAQARVPALTKGGTKTDPDRGGNPSNVKSEREKAVRGYRAAVSVAARLPDFPNECCGEEPVKITEATHKVLHVREVDPLNALD